MTAKEFFSSKEVLIFLAGLPLLFLANSKMVPEHVREKFKMFHFRNSKAARLIGGIPSEQKQVWTSTPLIILRIITNILVFTGIVPIYLIGLLLFGGFTQSPLEVGISVIICFVIIGLCIGLNLKYSADSAGVNNTKNPEDKFIIYFLIGAAIIIFFLVLKLSTLNS